MKKVVSLAFCIIIAFILLNGCSNQDIKIGYAACLTGTNSELGVSGMYGATLAVEEINQAGGIKGQDLALITKDDEGKPEKGLAVDKELKAEGCIAIVGHMTSDMAETTVPYVNENEMLMISPTIALPSLSNQDDYFFRMIPTTADQANQIAEGIVGQNISKLQIICSKGNSIFANYITSSLVEQLTTRTIEIEVLEDFQTAARGKFQQDIERIQNFDAEALVVIASADVASELAQALDQVNCKKIVFLPAWSMTSDLIKRGGPTVEGFYGVNFVDLESHHEEYLEFKYKYEQKFGYEPTFSSILSYESVMLLARAMKECRSYEARELKETILKTRVFQGLQEEIYLNEFGDVNRNIYLYQVQNGHFVKVG